MVSASYVLLHLLSYDVKMVLEYYYSLKKLSLLTKFVLLHCLPLASVHHQYQFNFDSCGDLLLGMGLPLFHCFFHRHGVPHSEVFSKPGGFYPAGSACLGTIVSIEELEKVTVYRKIARCRRYTFA